MAVLEFYSLPCPLIDEPVGKLGQYLPVLSFVIQHPETADCFHGCLALAEEVCKMS